MTTKDEALRAAREFIELDRTSAVDTNMNPVTNRVDDEEALQIIAEYDEVLAQIDAALGASLPSAAMAGSPRAGDGNSPARPFLPLPVLQALRFYARGEHYSVDEEHFESLSGEPENWQFDTRDDEETMFEDGGIAWLALTGGALNWMDSCGDGQPEPVEGEVWSDMLAAAPAVPAPAGQWTVSVAGPDDVYKFDSELDALRFANQVNRTYLADLLAHPGDEVLYLATVTDASPPLSPSPATVAPAEGGQS